MPILKSLKNNTKTVSFRLPSELVNDLDAVKSDAKARGFQLDLTEQIEKLIATSIRQARAELGEPSAAPETPAPANTV